MTYASPTQARKCENQSGLAAHNQDQDDPKRHESLMCCANASNGKLNATKHSAFFLMRWVLSVLLLSAMALRRTFSMCPTFRLASQRFVSFTIVRMGSLVRRWSIQGPEGGPIVSEVSTDLSRLSADEKRALLELLEKAGPDDVEFRG